MRSLNLREVQRAGVLWDIALYQLSQDRFTMWLCFFHGAAVHAHSLKEINDTTEEYLVAQIEREYPGVKA